MSLAIRNPEEAPLVMTPWESQQRHHGDMGVNADSVAEVRARIESLNLIGRFEQAEPLLTTMAAQSHHDTHATHPDTAMAPLGDARIEEHLARSGRIARVLDWLSAK